MSRIDRAAVRRANEQQHLLDALLCERDDLLSVLDRVLAMRGTARVIRDVAGADAAFVSEIDGSHGVIRWLAGNRTDALRELTVPVGQGVGGRVLQLGAPVRVRDYVSAPGITHQFDENVQRESLGAMVAVPIIDDRSPGSTLAVAYAALRGPGTFGDTAVTEVERIAAEAGRALRLAETAEAGRAGAVGAERRRMQASLHDSVGAMLFSIGAQVRDLRTTVPDNPLLVTRLGRLEADVTAASRALRESLLALSESGPERALPVELAEHCRSFEARTGVPARFVQLGAVDPLDRERTDLLVGAVREGLLNAEKHADPDAVVVSLGPVERGGIQVAVASDGAPVEDTEPVPDGSSGSGLGLRMLVDRAARLGGRVSLVHDEDGGTTLRAMLPAPP